jgi:hypothetical protein
MSKSLCAEDFKAASDLKKYDPKFIEFVKPRVINCHDIHSESGESILTESTITVKENVVIKEDSKYRLTLDIYMIASEWKTMCGIQVDTGNYTDNWNTIINNNLYPQEAIIKVEKL